jgi:hypothetical protein
MVVVMVAAAAFSSSTTKMVIRATLCTIGVICAITLDLIVGRLADPEWKMYRQASLNLFYEGRYTVPPTKRVPKS